MTVFKYLYIWLTTEAIIIRISVGLTNLHIARKQVCITDVCANANVDYLRVSFSTSRCHVVSPVLERKTMIIKNGTERGNLGVFSQFSVTIGSFHSGFDSTYMTL